MFIPFKFMSREVGEAVVYPHFPSTTEDWNTMANGLGISVTDLGWNWDFSESSGDLVDTINSTVLTAVGTFEYRVVPDAFPNEYGIVLTVNSNDRLQGGTSLFNFGSGESFLLSFVIQFGPSPSGDNRTVVQKFATTGYFMTMDLPGTIDWRIDDGVTNTVLNTSIDHSGQTHLIWMGRDCTGSMFLFTGNETLTGLCPTGDLTNGDQFRIGRFSTAGLEPIVNLQVFTGSSVEGLTVSDYNKYKAHLGL